MTYINDAKLRNLAAQQSELEKKGYDDAALGEPDCISNPAAWRAGWLAFQRDLNRGN